MPSPAEPAITVAIDRAVTHISRFCQWAVLLLTLATIFDVITRRFFVLGSVALQEAGWHLHAIFFLTALGYGYLRGAHVRIDLFSQRFSPRRQVIVEIFGFVFFMAPLSLLIFITGVDYAYIAYQTGEGSAASGGLPHRFIIKSFLPLGALMLFLAALARCIGNVMALIHGAEADAQQLILHGRVNPPDEKGPHGVSV